ncbi:defense response [Ranunculus cassubicifolius]
MESRSFGETDSLITRACSLSMKAHHCPSPTFLLDTTDSSSHAIFAFPGSWSVNEWFSRKSFGKIDIDLTLFPSIRRVGNTDTAIVNQSFLRQFQFVLKASTLQDEVRKAETENKQIVFTGHSSGGPVAILATIWLLERYRQKKQSRDSSYCMTFGSPLVGDQVFGHAIRREKWSEHFTHFVTRYDIVPRITLAPLSSIQQILPAILCFFNPNTEYFKQETIGKSIEAVNFVRTVMRNAASLSSHAASLYMGSTNLLLQSITSFVELSPYRPFGTYVFCNGNGKMVTVKNADVVLQMFFYCLQCSPEEDNGIVAYRSLHEHLMYEAQLQNLSRQEVVQLDNLKDIPLTTNGADNEEKRVTDILLTDFGLSSKARICLRAAGELEKQKIWKQNKIDSNYAKIKDALNELQKYQARCEVREVYYYDAFKVQKEEEDFKANIKRLKLAGMWDEIIVMLGRYELLDDFEARKEWVDLGTTYRRLVEPLDIANYYRHGKNDDTGPYMTNGRPWRYRCTQRWQEHASHMESDSCMESCILAEVEELCKRTFEEGKERVLRLESDVKRWVSRGEISKEVFLAGSTFVKWWKTLPPHHRAMSGIATLIDNQRSNLYRRNTTLGIK